MTFPEVPPELQKYLQPSSHWLQYNGYEPLKRDRGEIRLLHINFLDGTERIEASFQTPRIKDDAEYEALSYCWGPPDELRTIVIDDQEVVVRRSLYEFLLTLCYRGQEVPVWIDSLCINQGDTEERSWQVSIMNSIYRSASRVRAWLGPSDADSDYVFDYIKHKEALKSFDYDEEDVNRRVSKSLSQLMHRPYWQRLWIVQELALARQVVLHCGSRTTSWSKFLETGSQMLQPRPNAPLMLGDSRSNADSSNEHASSYYLSDAERVEWQRVSAVDAIRKANDHESVGMWDRAREFRHHLCEDSRDKMFALISLSDPSSCPSIDYSTSTLNVFLETLFLKMTYELLNGPKYRTKANLVTPVLQEANDLLPHLMINLHDIAAHLFEMERQNTQATLTNSSTSFLRRSISRPKTSSLSDWLQRLEQSELIAMDLTHDAFNWRRPAPKASHEEEIADYALNTIFVRFISKSEDEVQIKIVPTSELFYQRHFPTRRDSASNSS